MVKSGKVLIVLSFVITCFMAAQKANAVITLDLWITGDYNVATATLENAEVHRTNTDFGLGGLSYNLQLTESLELSREYSDHDWIADDGIFDASNPVDINGGSVLDWFTSIRFDTVHDPVGSEFSSGSSGIVEAFTFSPLDDLTPRWIYFDLVAPSASDGSGQDLVNTLGGSINIIDTIVIPSGFDPPAPEPNHTLAVYVPEPTTLIFFGLGGLFLRKKRKT